MNALLHSIEVDDSQVVDTAFGLTQAITNFRDAVYEDLADTYVVERVRETLSDGSINHLIRIRIAEPI